MSTQETSTSGSGPPHSVPDHRHHELSLGEYELSGGNRRAPFILTWAEVKLLGIAGVGFFLDAYDLFIINPVTTMLQFRLYGGHPLPTGLEGFVKAAANIGSVIGQLSFGYAADYFGRKAVYGKELMLIIVATILCISDPTGEISPNAALIWLGVFRILLGVGVGGDYPMSAAVATDRVHLRKRGVFLAYIFANQGWGSLVGSLVTMIVLLCYKDDMQGHGETSDVDGAWRIVIGFSLIPAFGTLYQRLTLPESKKYVEARLGHFRLNDASVAENGGIPDSSNEKTDEKKADEKKTDEKKPSGNDASAKKLGSSSSTDTPTVKVVESKFAHFKEFCHYFSEWRHLKLLIGTSMCWFLLDIAFYGINLNQNVVLQQIGYAGKSGTAWNRIFRISTGNLIITVLGFVPGYYVTVLTIEYLGRKWIQIQGFLLEALFLGVLAGCFHRLSHASFIVCFAFLQFFFNFGANATTYCYPAEIFPTQFRATAHGISAASGKAGAIISALAFNSLSKQIGTPAVLWIFFGCCMAGSAFTLLLPEVRGRDPDIVYAQELAEASK